MKPALALAACLVLALTFTTLVYFPGSEMCQSRPFSGGAGPLRASSGGNCDLRVECVDFAVDVCE